MKTIDFPLMRPPNYSEEFSSVLMEVSLYVILAENIYIIVWGLKNTFQDNFKFFVCARRFDLREVCFFYFCLPIIDMLCITLICSCRLSYAP